MGWIHLAEVGTQVAGADTDRSCAQTFLEDTVRNFSGLEFRCREVDCRYVLGY